MNSLVLRRPTARAQRCASRSLARSSSSPKEKEAAGRPGRTDEKAAAPASSLAVGERREGSLSHDGGAEVRPGAVEGCERRS